MAVLRGFHCLGLDSYMYKSENFALTFCIVRLLVKAVAGGASKGSGKQQAAFVASI